MSSDKIRYGRISREGDAVTVHFSTRDQRDAAVNKLGTAFTDLVYTTEDQAEAFTLTARLKPETEKQVQEFAVQQNITTLRNRVNELGVAEPVIQQQSPRGETIYWIGPAGDAREAGEGTDFHATASGLVSITPLQVDLTDHAALGAWQDTLAGTGAR